MAEGLKNNPKNLHNYTPFQVNELISRWSTKTEIFLEHEYHEGWQSWNYADQQTLNKLRNIVWEKYHLPEPEPKIIEQNSPEPKTEPQTERIETENYRY